MHVLFWYAQGKIWERMILDSLSFVCTYSINLVLFIHSLLRTCLGVHFVALDDKTSVSTGCYIHSFNHGPESSVVVVSTRVPVTESSLTP
jgi:hypothetical protein